MTAPDRPTPEQVEAADGNERAYIADAMRTGAGHLSKLGNKTSTSAGRYNDGRSESLNRVARHYYRAADAIRDAAVAVGAHTPLPAAARPLLPMERDGAIEAAAQALGDGHVGELDEELAARAVDAAILCLSSQPYPVVLGPLPAVSVTTDVVARTPQPAEPSPLDTCGERLTSLAGTGPYFCDLAAEHEGCHEVHDGPRWLFDPTHRPSVAPLPAVPDGEDRPGNPLEPDVADMADVRQALRAALRGRDKHADEAAQLRDQLARAHALNRKQHRELVGFIGVPPFDGEDVPARLDAAAEALVFHAPWFVPPLHELACDFRNGAVPAEVRAAVAAALARPTERES